MSRESERAVLDGSNTSAEPLSGLDQELEAKLDRDEQEGCVSAGTVNRSLASAGEKLNGFTDMAKEKESVNGGMESNVDEEETKEIEKVPDDSKEVVTVKDSDGIQTALLVDKEVELSSHSTKLSDVNGSNDKLDSEEDLAEDSKPDCSGKQGTEAENLNNESFMGLEPHESKDESTLDNETSPVATKVKISDSGLVLAKVRSYPWWPGQVFDASAATAKANKHFKKGSYLVAYFGDCSFAWNDASKLKPFRQHFSQMSKQSTLPDFLDAIDFALEEVSRRIEFGLACSCISEEVYEKIKTQTIINPGIRQDSSRIHGGDKVSSAVFFEPTNLVEYVKRLACSPSCNDTDELQFVSQRTKLLAFNRWKGYNDLPKFETLQGSIIESAPKISPAEVKESSEQVYTKKRKTEGQDDCKDDGVFEYEDATAPKKKEKTLADFIAEKRLSRSNGKKLDCEKKRKVVDAELHKSSKKKIKANLKQDSGSPLSPKNDRECNLSSGDKSTAKKAKTSFGIEASILKVANQMHCSTPTGPIPCSNSTSKMAAKDNGSGKSLQGKPKAEALFETKPSASKTVNGKPTPISVDSLHSEELEHASTETPSTNLVDDSMLESRDLKDSSKEDMVSEERNGVATTVGEISIEINLTEEKITGSVLKEEPNNTNCSK